MNNNGTRILEQAMQLCVAGTRTLLSSFVSKDGSTQLGTVRTTVGGRGSHIPIICVPFDTQTNKTLTEIV